MPFSGLPVHIIAAETGPTKTSLVAKTHKLKVKTTILQGLLAWLTISGYEIVLVFLHLQYLLIDIQASLFYNDDLMSY